MYDVSLQLGEQIVLHSVEGIPRCWFADVGNSVNRIKKEDRAEQKSNVKEDAMLDGAIDQITNKNNTCDQYDQCNGKCQLR